ncbi:MAG: tRNA (adenosine(37)-N6)-dimethylallyltransferase MiaA [Faecousia sp.]
MVCVAGPTASGKTELAVWLAEELNGEVVSCDSMQVYRAMDIGTAKPSLAERRGIPHHMMDVCDPDEPMSVGKFTDLATPIVEDILSRGKTVILAGGTGLYMDALVRGNDFAPTPETGCREALRHRLETEGAQALLAELATVDPESAERLHTADTKRIIRALEVYQETGKTISAHNAETKRLPDRFQPCWIGLDYVNRQDLYRRIDLRVDRMLEAGLLEEIRGLLTVGSTALQAIGYKEFLPVLEGRCTLEEAAAQVKQSSRRYAKRQLTWFRRNPEMQWIHKTPDMDFSQVCEAARGLIPFFDEGK